MIFVKSKYSILLLFIADYLDYIDLYCQVRIHLGIYNPTSGNFTPRRCNVDVNMTLVSVHSTSYTHHLEIFHVCKTFLSN